MDCLTHFLSQRACSLLYTGYLFVFLLDIVWLDGSLWDFSQTDITSDQYFDPNTPDHSENRTCFTLDVEIPGHFSMDYCYSEYRDMCYHPDVSDVPLGGHFPTMLLLLWLPLVVS